MRYQKLSIGYGMSGSYTTWFKHNILCYLSDSTQQVLLNSSELFYLPVLSPLLPVLFSNNKRDNILCLLRLCADCCSTSNNLSGIKMLINVDDPNGR